MSMNKNRIIELAGLLQEGTEAKPFAKKLAEVPGSKSEEVKKIADESGLDGILVEDKDWKAFIKALTKAYEAGMKSNDE